MGTAQVQRKKLDGEEGSYTEQLLAELEEDVRNAVIEGSQDLVLARLVDITVRSIISERELFDNPLHEPVFYQRYFRPWVNAALDERNEFDNMHNQALKSLGLIQHGRE